MRGINSLLADKISRRALLASSLVAGAAVALPRAARAQATVLRWGTVLAPTHPEAIMMDRIANEVREATGGAVDIQTFPGGQLGSPRDMVEATASGAQTMVCEGAAQLGQFVPQLTVMEAPYVWRDVEHMKRALSSPLLDDLNAPLIEQRGLRMIGSTYYGKRHLTTGDKPVRSVEDMAGFKLRIPELDMFRAMVEAWGASPTPINFNELYLALSQGAVDGQENPLPTIASGKLNEVQEYLVLTGHIITPRLVTVNEPAWEALSSEHKGVIELAIATHTAWQDGEITAQEESLLGTFEAGGMQVIEPDLESFREPVLAALPAQFESTWGTGTWERIQSI